MFLRTWVAIIVCGVWFALAGCEKEGPLERAGEEVDEAVDTVKEGEEPVGAKIDDTIDEAREGVDEMKDEAKENP